MDAGTLGRMTDGSPTLDAVSRLLLAEAPRLASGPHAAVALVDADPALDGVAVERWADVRCYRDRLDGGESTETLADAVRGADLVLLALPKSLGALEEYAEVIAAHAAPGVQVVAAGRVKHMTRTQNTVLERCFRQVRASRGVGKCRALHASGPTTSRATWPRTAVEPTSGLTLVAHGNTFAGARLDAGTRLLLSTQDRWPASPDGLDAVDLGCGNGVLAAVLAGRGDRVTALDISRDAVASTRATLHHNGLHGEVLLADGLAVRPDASADLVVTNPPFHVGTAKDSTPTLGMIRDAARVLRPGGELWVVYNTHLPYLQAARAAFGDVRVIERDRDFTVLRARQR